jgi:hypothetical protein
MEENERKEKENKEKNSQKIGSILKVVAARRQ